MRNDAQDLQKLSFWFVCIGVVELIKYYIVGEITFVIHTILDEIHQNWRHCSICKTHRTMIFLNFFISHHIPHNQQSLQVLPGAFKLKINTFSSDFPHLPSLSSITHTHFKLLQELYSNICSIRKKALSHY